MAWTRWRGSAGNVSLLLVFVCLLAAEPHPALAQDRAAERPPSGTYRRPLRAEPPTLDPARITDVFGRAIAQQIFDGLVEFDQTLSVVPALAQFWTSSRNGLVWTFTLRKNVRFHHGRELTSDDVVYSLTRLVDPKVKSGAADVFFVIKGASDFHAGRARHVSGLVAVDRYTVQIVLSQPFTAFVSLFATGHAKIVPRDLVERDADAFGLRPVGTGPFRFTRWDRGREIALEANPEYFNAAPKLAHVVFRLFPSSQWDTVYDEFVRGGLEDAPVPARDYARATQNPAHMHVRRGLFSVRFYGFNTKMGPLADRRVRQAIIHAIDREGIVQQAHFGRYVPARGIVPPGTLGFNPDLAGYKYDPALAKALLAKAGFPNGKGLPVLEIWAATKEGNVVREHDEIGKELAAVGIRTEFKYLSPWTEFTRQLGQGRLAMFQYAWWADVPDADNFLFRLFHSQSPGNLFGYRNPAVDSLLVSARAASEIQQRVDLYRRVEQMILDDAPIVPVWHYNYERLFQKYVRSVEVNGLGDPYVPLRKIWLDRQP